MPGPDPTSSFAFFKDWRTIALLVAVAAVAAIVGAILSHLFWTVG